MYLNPCNGYKQYVYVLNCSMHAFIHLYSTRASPKSYFYHQRILDSCIGIEMKSESGKESVEHEAFSRKLIVAAVFVGILLIWVAQLVLIWPDWTDTEMTKIGVKITTTLIGLGGVISSVALIGGAILNKSIDKFVRLGMLVAAGLILGQVLPMAMTYSSIWQLL